MKKFLILGLIAVMFLSGTFVAYAAMEKKVTVQFSDGRPQVQSVGLHSTLTDALASAGQNVGELEKNYQPSIPWDKQLNGDADVLLTCKCKVSLELGGKNLGTFTTTRNTVGAFLEERKVTLSAWDQPNVSVNDMIKPNMHIVIDKVEQRVKKETKSIKFTIKEEKDNTLPDGQKKITTVGKPGMQIYQVVALYKNGQLLMENGKAVISKTLIDEITPITQIVKLGTNKQSAQQTSGQLVSGSEQMFQATAYTSTGGSKTASGTTPHKGTIAVDPSVIPLGTKLYVEGYGYGVAEDTGGAIKGHIIDLYFTNESDCIQWGRKSVKVYIVK